MSNNGLSSSGMRWFPNEFSEGVGNTHDSTLGPSPKTGQRERGTIEHTPEVVGSWATPLPFRRLYRHGQLTAEWARLI